VVHYFCLKVLTLLYANESSKAPLCNSNACVQYPYPATSQSFHGKFKPEPTFTN
jgi:hypothetical protein